MKGKGGRKGEKDKGRKGKEEKMREERGEEYERKYQLYFRDRRTTFIP